MQLEELNKIVKEKLGKTLRIEDKFTLSNLNAISIELIKNAKALENTYYIESFLQFYVQQKDWKYLKAYVHQVVLGNQSGALWRKGRVLIPNVSLTDQLTKEKETIYGVYISKVNHIIIPNFNEWLQGVGTVGAFAIPEQHADYTSEIPIGFLSMEPVNLLKIDVNKIDIVFRRWIASRIARYLKSINMLNNIQEGIYSLEELAAKSLWTYNAQKAIDGLIKEKEICVWDINSIPGFHGPDDFYI